MIFLLLLPLGLLWEGAWGEWGGEELRRMLGFLPQGIKKFSGLWRAPFSGYSLPFLGEVPSYLLAGILGAGAVFLFFYLLDRVRR